MIKVYVVRAKDGKLFCSPYLKHNYEGEDQDMADLIKYLDGAHTKTAPHSVEHGFFIPAETVEQIRRALKEVTNHCECGECCSQAEEALALLPKTG